MAFLDNSGDIILDAVLTDTGRMRLAKADGSFKISVHNPASSGNSSATASKIHFLIINNS